MTYDVVIRNGLIVDGSGAPGYPADLGIRGGRIAAIGQISERGGTEDINAEGHVVTPGFIDAHTHMDAQVMWDPLGTCSCWHGVTTVVMGNCGFTLAPVRSDKRELVIRNLERAEDISAAAMACGIDWTWESFPEYLDELDRRPKGINYSGYVGHSALRTWAMGERAFESESSPDDIKSMENALRASLDAGAIGFTTSRSRHHETSDDRPVASRMSSWEEVCRLVTVMRSAGHGIFQLTPGASPGSDPELWDHAYGQIFDLAIDSGVPTTFGLVGSREEQLGTLSKLESAQAAGARVFGQSSSRGVSSVLSLKARLPFDSLPEWSDLRALSIERQLHTLRDPSRRQRLIRAASFGDYGRRIGAEARKPDFDAMRILDAALPPHVTVAERAAAQQIEPVQLIINLIMESEGDQLFMQPINEVDGETQLKVMKHPNAVMTFSDSGAHVSQIMDSSIQTHLLAHWVRNLHRLSLEEAVQMITATPARLWGFTDRGLLCAGNVADINIFDPDTVAPQLPTVETDLPGGAKRLKQQSIGFLATLVNGQVLLREGVHTGALPGELIRAGG